MIGKLMLNVLSQLQLLSGQERGLLEHPRPLPVRHLRKNSSIHRWHHLGRGWLLHLRHYLWKIGASIKIQDSWRIAIQREHDPVIMDAINQRCRPSEYELSLVNSVRLFLHVQVLSDIVSMDGKATEPWARQCCSPRVSHLWWPVQDLPSREAIRLWRKNLRLTFGSRRASSWKQHVLLALENHLARWRRQSHIKYDYYWTMTDLYVRRADGKFDRHQAQSSQWTIARRSTVSDLPADASPTSAQVHSTFLIIPSGPRGVERAKKTMPCIDTDRNNLNNGTGGTNPWVTSTGRGVAWNLYRFIGGATSGGIRRVL